MREHFSLDDLAAIVRARASAEAATSYTKSLLDKGAARCAKKFGEEAIELVIAVAEGEKSAIVGETADVFYHLTVLLEASGVSLSEVMSELHRRTAQSGHEEKASR